MPNNPMALTASQTFATLSLAGVPDGVIQDAMVATHETGKPAPAGPFTLWAGNGTDYLTERWRVTQ